MLVVDTIQCTNFLPQCPNPYPSSCKAREELHAWGRVKFDWAWSHSQLGVILSSWTCWLPSVGSVLLGLGRILLSLLVRGRVLVDSSVFFHWVSYSTNIPSYRAWKGSKRSERLFQVGVINYSWASSPLAARVIILACWEESHCWPFSVSALYN